ncbi:isochorismatase family protein [[Clostridium] colinum]|uniref:isochorismatase family protein n=1 Tax=[Clostridium] colinum TaxID=36835 RepID=UPI0020259C51|nr:isochorismatase family protein [[Clostridium] colinum]
MKNLLIIVDYQYDFVADDGLLTAGVQAQNIENNIYNLSNIYIKNNDDIIFTLDSHISQEWNIHPESKSFNIHCEKSTKGYEPFGKTKNILSYKNCKTLEKKGYCPTINDINNIINNYKNIEICGVVTDICVLQTAISLYNACVNSGKKINFKVNSNACASFNLEGHKFAIDYMKNILGFEVI